ncbi:hypothetical protein [Streptacidiphilus carbonis]|uniref:hypothetical protein n=1 Tax=Streptacidiphilus carbonis TaxID=105422 RepID=UPI0005AB6CD9|nr:hypothetical protein [Streptacidiphilus carbonis]
MGTSIPSHHAMQARDNLRELTAGLAHGDTGFSQPKDLARTLAALAELAELLSKSLLLSFAGLGAMALDPAATVVGRLMTETATTATDLAVQLEQIHELVGRLPRRR